MHPLLGSVFRPKAIQSFAALAAPMLVAAWLFMAAPVQAQTQLPSSQTQTQSQAAAEAATAENNGPIRLRPGAKPALPNDGRDQGRQKLLEPAAEPVKAQPGEFEVYVQKLAAPVEVRRFGSELMTPTDDSETANTSPLVPADYLIKPGDELQITLWGSVDADLRQVVDRSGRISIPRVGPVLVAGVRYADLPGVISQRVAQVFRNFQVSVSLGQLRGLRVYVTGFVAKPGAYHVSSLATVVEGLLAAGGPSAAGSFRQIDILRNRQRVAEFDLYALLINGDRSADLMLQADDVIHVGPVGKQVALIGSVNRAAIFELKPGETVTDLLRMAGGFSTVADRARLSVERLDDRASVRIVELALPASNNAEVANGDVLRAFSAVDAALPVQRQNKRVRVEGEVRQPGEYVLPPESSVADALAVAGGLTERAYLFGTEFNRESVRITQQKNYDRALRDLETDLARNVTSQRTSGADEASAQTARTGANERLLASLRALTPNGRIVLQLQPDTRELPALMLEDGDRLYIPPRPTSVGVFGSVFNGGSYLYGEGREIDDYLGLAGGPTRGADARSTFVIRANGSVVSGRQHSGWFGGETGLSGLKAEAGDTIFVPEEMNKTTFIQNAKDWTQILYQFGLGIAAINTISK